MELLSTWIPLAISGALLVTAGVAFLRTRRALRTALPCDSQVEQNALLRGALNVVSANVMIADTDARIIYANRSVLAMMANAQADLRSELPDFDASRVIGASIDIFHKDPAHQRRLLKALERQFTSEFRIAGRTLRIIANPIMDADRGRLGTVVEWTDRTQEVAVENEVQAIVECASKGDLAPRINPSGKTGFFLSLAHRINALLGVSQRVVDDAAATFRALAHGDLTRKIGTEYEGSFRQLKEDANGTVDRLREAVTSIRECSSAVGDGIAEISAGNADLSQRTESQASNLEETAASVEQMTSSVRETADNAQQASMLAAMAREHAENGGTVVTHAIQAMSEISASSQRIAEIIGVIDGIAFQTNLLALNAAVEAARAGEQGRGFAVVASEVRSLAGRSANAAKEVRALIESSVSTVENGSRLVERSGEALREIVASVKKVNDINGEIANASSEQALGIEQVNTALTQMDQITQRNAALVQKAASASDAIDEQIRRLIGLMAFFTIDAAAPR